MVDTFCADCNYKYREENNRLKVCDIFYVFAGMKDKVVCKKRENKTFKLAKEKFL